MANIKLSSLLRLCYSDPIVRHVRKILGGGLSTIIDVDTESHSWGWTCDHTITGVEVLIGGR